MQILLLTTIYCDSFIGARKLLIFPLNFGLSYFVLVLVFSLSASELASASLLVPNYIFGVIRSYIYVWFSIFTLLVACKKSFACCCCNFFHPRYFVYRSLSKIHIDVVRRRMFLRPDCGVCIYSVSSKLQPVANISVWASTPICPSVSRSEFGRCTITLRRKHVVSRCKRDCPPTQFRSKHVCLRGSLTKIGFRPP